MPTFTQIGTAQVVGSGGQAAIDFTSIPSTYTDLCLELSSRATGAGANGINVKLQFNGDTGSNYSYRRIYGQSSTVASTSATGTFNISGISVAGADTANTFSNNAIYIPNYAGSTQKSYSVDGVAENNSVFGFLTLIAGLWTSTSAITSINLTNDGYNFAQYTTAYLYGVSNA
jgi:hypothetical protein